MGLLGKIFGGQKDAQGIATDVAMLIAQESFHKFREPEFRKQLNFSNLDQEEQDRIFNELVITGLCLVYLTLERGELENAHEKSRETFRQIKNQLAGGYARTLAEGGVEKEFTDLWYQLIAMRCEEYRQDFKEHRDLFDDPWVNYWIHVCAIGGSDHICRGKGEQVEKLLPDLTRWCGKIYIESMRSLAGQLHATLSEGGKSVKVDVKDDGSLDVK
ncbi:MAG: hypothetical protein P4L74_03380 [Candidatus Doudnabacteria bacterium]|nr:hypothetical protein [Candidatus Doudnabacteria bacterium]